MRVYSTVGFQTYVANWVMAVAQIKSFLLHSNEKWSSWKKRRANMRRLKSYEPQSHHCQNRMNLKITGQDPMKIILLTENDGFRQNVSFSPNQ